MSDTSDLVCNARDADAREILIGDHWGGRWASLTPAMRPRGGSLGVNEITIPPGRAAVPFHAHAREDEAFYVLRGRGVFRYGDEPLRELGPGDCVSCPADTAIAHQLANPFDEEFVYLAIGLHDPHEVCTYPDNGKVLVRSVGIGRLQEAPYMDGEPDTPVVLERWRND